MNVKTLAAIVGTLSLGALATGCATTKAGATTDEKAADHGCKTNAAATTDKGGQAQCGGQKAASTSEKGEQHGCGAAGCGGPSSNPK